jgi:D-amino-acid dehydrogenase
MKVAILGAGIMGITTAYFLKKRGYDVSIIDRQAEAASECSFANGGQLSYNHAEPWATPAALKNAIKWMGQEDAPLLFRLRADPAMWIWCLKFLSQCRDKNVKKNTRGLLGLGLYSRQIMHDIVADVPMNFDYQRNGKLFIFQTEENFDAARKQMDFQTTVGGSYELLTGAECVAHEPTLAHIGEALVGGISDPGDEAGDAHKYCVEMAKWLRDQGVIFHYNTSIAKLRCEGKRIVSVETDRGDIEADMFVMAMGSFSPLLLKTVGIKVPIYPLKGYSISVKINDESKAPKTSITHSREKIVYSRLGNVLRAAGTAEFAGYDQSITKARIDILKRDMHYLFPMVGDIDGADEWACLRPATPGGLPILGKSPIENLYLNAGQGTLGWTQAAGSAKIVADIIEGKDPEHSMVGLTLGCH